MASEPVTTEGETVDLGAGFSAGILRDDEGREVAIRIDHHTVSGEPCQAEYVVEGGAADSADSGEPRVGIERRDPLTLDRPLGCARCGTVGWVVEGHWSDHGRRRSMRRHPATTWARGSDHAITAGTKIDVRPADPDRFVTEWITS